MRYISANVCDKPVGTKLNLIIITLLRCRDYYFIKMSRTNVPSICRESEYSNLNVFVFLNLSYERMSAFYSRSYKTFFIFNRKTRGKFYQALKKRDFSNKTSYLVNR